MHAFKSNQHGVPKFVPNEPNSEKGKGAVEDVEEGYMDATLKKLIKQL